MSSFYNSRRTILHTKHNLPHWHQNQTWTFATWRLKDSIPQSKLCPLEIERKRWISKNPKPWDELTEQAYHQNFTNKVEEWLDKGMGSCLLQESAISTLVTNTLQHFNQTRYLLHGFVVMPNHVHVLFLPAEHYEISKIIKSWKGYSAHLINKQLNTEGPVWQPDYWDRLIRNEPHFFKTADYIKSNPTKTNLRKDQYRLYCCQTISKKQSG